MTILKNMLGETVATIDDFKFGPVVGITMVKDEIDIIEYTVDNMLRQCDNVIAWDDGSTDGTYEWLCDKTEHLPCDLRVWDDANVDRPGYYQSERMTKMARAAYAMGAEWVVPFDADEYWISACPDYPLIKDVLNAHQPDYGIIKAQVLDHMATGIASHPILERLKWYRTEPLAFPKVAARATADVVIEQGNHWAKYNVPALPTPDHRLIVHHYPYRSPEQVIKKIRNGAAAYALTDLPANIGSHWREWGKLSDEQIIEIFYKWYYRPNPLVNDYMIDGVIQPNMSRWTPS